jgi:putative N-acetylmannosamine-6-phosphate epimerase
VTPGWRERLRHKLIVSCQALPGSPLRDPAMIAALARCAVLGGAAGLRIDGPGDVAAVRRVVDVPVIGLYKLRGRTVYITPTFAEARALADAGADLIAVQATQERDADEAADPLPALIARIRTECGLPIMADVSTLDEGRAAAANGADLVATTMAGYTPRRDQTAGPDLDLVRALAREVAVPVVAEGRITNPEEAVAALRAGAWAVVVGRAITMPEAITERFVRALARAAGEA